MSQRQPGEENSEPGAAYGKRDPSGGGLRFPLGMSRTQQMGNRGLAASSIGLTLAGCIILGFVAGSWLDRRFGTQYWTPILFLVGVAAGFRELFRTVSQLDAANKEKRAQRAQAATPSPTPVEMADAATGAPKEAERAPQVLEAPARQRLFSVPPPPFLEQAGEIVPTPSAEEVKRRLLGDSSEQGEAAEEKRDAV